MASSLLENIVTNADLTVLLSAVALGVGGLALIAANTKLGTSRLTKRVDSILPKPIAVPAGTGQQPHATSLLFRLPEQGIPDAESREIVRKMAPLGVPANRARLYFTAFRLALAFVLAALAYALFAPGSSDSGFQWVGLALPIALALLGWLLPSFYIGSAMKKRSKAVSSALPDGLELLVVCVEAGLSLENGLDRVVQEFAHSEPELASELAMTAADLKILPNRDQAFANLAERVDMPNVRSVVNTLSQTLRYGTPLAQSLRRIAAEMRSDYLVALEERANKLPALLTLPVMLFLMPTIFLMIGGPAALRMIDVLQKQ